MSTNKLADKISKPRIKNLPLLIKTHTFCPGLRGRHGVNFNFVGGSGIGKSYVLEKIIRQWGIYFEAITLNNRDVTDLLGLPFIDRPAGRVPRTGYAAPGFAIRAGEAGHAMIFIDELGTTRPELQQAALRVINEGFAGDYEIPETVRFCAAMNDPDSAAGGYPLTSPSANRWFHYDWMAPSVAEFGGFMSGLNPGYKNGVKAELVGDHTTEEIEDQLMPIYTKAYPNWHGRVQGFLAAKPTLLHKEPERDDPQASKAWPSPRMWELTTKMLAMSEATGLEDHDRNVIVHGGVGPDSAVQFSAWMRDNNLPDAAAVLDGRISWQPDKRFLDISHAVLSSCTATIKLDQTNRQARYERFWQILNHTMGFAAELVLPQANELIDIGLKISNADSLAAYRNIMKRMNKVADAIQGRI